MQDKDKSKKTVHHCNSYEDTEILLTSHIPIFKFRMDVLLMQWQN